MERNFSVEQKKGESAEVASHSAHDWQQLHHALHTTLQQWIGRAQLNHSARDTKLKLRIQRARATQQSEYMIILPQHAPQVTQVTFRQVE